MKDLFVLTADADAQALMAAVLRRHRALQIRALSFDVRSFPGRDAGMVKEGPEIARALVKKEEYSRLLLIWDHDGSGWHKLTEEEATGRIQQRLDGVTWADRSDAIVLMPELEEWLWHCPVSLVKTLGVSSEQFNSVTARAAKRLNLPLEKCRQKKPKELFEAVLYSQTHRRPLPEDFSKLAASANLEEWCGSSSFARLVNVLRRWFPA